jgi:3-phenylpropionate/trans-cinnamate dioxygenase ferredoxin reductase component
MAAGVVIVGAGQAGLQAALSLREFGYPGEVTLVGSEPHLPYHRPSLSKRGLAEPIGAADLAIRNQVLLDAKGIDLELGAIAVAIDRSAKSLILSDGRALHYSALVIATGSVPRRLSLHGADAANVLGLKDIADLDRLRGLLGDVRRAVMIGGGFIGLELAASLTRRGVAVTVLEAAPRLLARVASEDLSAHVAATHRANGVDIRTGATVAGLSGIRRVDAVALADDEVLATDLVVVGIGADADDRLASAAGLAVDRGILVGADGGSSDPAIYAAGDCARYIHPLYGESVRLESVNNAVDQGRRVAATIVRRPQPTPSVPWFWSDQFDLKIQLAGLPSPLDGVEIVESDEGLVRHFVRDGVLRAIEAVNAPKAFTQGRRRIETEMAALAGLRGAA